MSNGTSLALPGWTRWVKRLVIGHAAFYVAWLVFGRWAGLPEVAREMIFVPQSVHEGNVWQLATYVLSFENPLAFLFDMLALWMFGATLESRWGPRRFLTFYLICAIGSSAVVALLALVIPALALQPSLGPGAAILGLVVAWGIIYAEQPVYFFGLFPLKGKHLLMIVIGAMVLYALASNPLAFVINAVGMILAALIVIGFWRPGQIAGSLRGAWLRWRARRARKHLKAVGDDDDRRYLH